MKAPRIIIPPYLQKGDTIGIVCPAGYMPKEKAETCIRVLQQWGYKVRTGQTLGHQHHYFSGTDDERLDDLQAMLDDPTVKAILCGRGGYGSNRIIDRIDWRAFKRSPKWIIGFSDITMFHSYLYTKLHTASLHAPMAAAFNDDGHKGPYVRSLRTALSGGTTMITSKAHRMDQHGEAIGTLIGGNLSLVAHQVGTPSDIDTKGKILFIEDVGEYIYNVDRMMIQLQRSGKLNDLAGLIVGGFTDMKDTTTPFGATAMDVIKEKVAHLRIPVCFDFPVSHGKKNYALKVGCTYRLSVGKKVSLQEL